MDEPQPIEATLLKSRLFLVFIGVIAIVAIFEAISNGQVFARAFEQVDWAVVAILIAFGSITTLLIQACMTPGEQTKTSKREFVIGRFMFWFSFLAFAVAVLLFFGPNGILTYDRPDFNQYLVFHKDQISQVCGKVGESYGQPKFSCFAFNGTDFIESNNSITVSTFPSFLSDKNWSSEPKNISSVFYKHQ